MSLFLSVNDVEDRDPLSEVAGLQVESSEKNEKANSVWVNE